MDSRPFDIRDRTYLFTREVVAFCRTAAERDAILRRLALQLVDAAGSVGANTEEADDGQSKADFISKNCIALKEAREAKFWLRQLRDAEPSLAARATSLIDEAEQLRKILRTIIARAKEHPGDRGRGSL